MSSSGQIGHDIGAYGSPRVVRAEPKANQTSLYELPFKVVGCSKGRGETGTCGVCFGDRELVLF